MLCCLCLFAFRVNLPKTLRLSTQKAIQEHFGIQMTFGGFNYGPKSWRVLQKLRSRKSSPAISGIRGSGSWAAIRNLPSTGAGGQDDVSSQANSLKLAAFSGVSSGCVQFI